MLDLNNTLALEQIYLETAKVRVETDQKNAIIRAME